MRIMGPCPPADALTAPPRPQRIEEHLRTCVRCRALLKALPPASGSQEDHVPLATTPPHPEAGAVYAVRCLDSAEMEVALVLEVCEDELVVWPVSEEPSLATDADLVLPADVLGFAGALHPSIAGTVLPEQLDEAVGLISDAQRAAAERGAPVRSEGDPRLAANADLSERWQPYFEPAEAFRVTVTLGELIARGRTMRQLSATDLAEPFGVPEGVIDKLEEDELDLVSELPPSTLAGVLRRLAVVPSLKLGARVRQAVIATTSPGASQAPAYRQRRGAARGVDRTRASDYATSVLSALAQAQEEWSDGKQRS
jgi:hypothetical protein